MRVDDAFGAIDDFHAARAERSQQEDDSTGHGGAAPWSMPPRRLRRRFLESAGLYKFIFTDL
jgi:hypothetical protein